MKGRDFLRSVFQKGDILLHGGNVRRVTEKAREEGLCSCPALLPFPVHRKSLGSHSSVGLNRNFEAGGNRVQVIRAAYQVGEAYSGVRRFKIFRKAGNLYAVLKKFASFFPAAVDIFYRDAELYNQNTAVCVLEAVHAPVIDIGISKPAEVTNRKPPPHVAADRTSVREPENRTAAAPAGSEVDAPARIRTAILDPGPADHGTAAGKSCDHIVCQNRRLAGAEAPHRNSCLQGLPRSGGRTDGAWNHFLLNIVEDTYHIQLDRGVICERNLIGNDISGADSAGAGLFRGGGTNTAKRAVRRLAGGRRRQVEPLNDVFFAGGKRDMGYLRSPAKGGILCDGSR